MKTQKVTFTCSFPFCLFDTHRSTLSLCENIFNPLKVSFCKRPEPFLETKPEENAASVTSVYASHTLFSIGANQILMKRREEKKTVYKNPSDWLK